MRLIIVFFIFLSFAAKSQIDTLFWFAAPEVTSLHGDRPIRLVVSSYSKPCSIEIDIPSNLAFNPIQFNLNANTGKIIDLTPYIDLIENKVINVTQKTGLRIQSSAMMSAYYEVAHVANTDIFTLKGNNALGMEFYLPFQTQYDNAIKNLQNTNWAGVEILAIEDNTVINVFPTKPFVSHNSNFSISLNKGEVYTLRSESIIGNQKPIATRITSNKPISISINDDSVIKHEPLEGWDLIGDQLIPVNKLGQEFIVRAGFVFIIATENNTNISLDGNIYVTLNQGESHKIKVESQAHYLKSSKPISVFQVINVSGELAGAVLPQINCTGANSIRFTRSADASLFLDIITKKGSEQHFKVNGKSGIITSNDFNTVPGTNGKWLFANINFSSQAFIKTGELTIVTNKTNPFHLGVLTGEAYRMGARYGFFSNFGSFDLGPDIEVCGVGPIQLSGGLGRDTYNWSTSGSPTLSQAEVLEVTQSGVYKLTATEGVNCQIEDSIEITFFDLPQVSLQSESKFCEGESLLIKATKGYEKYEWNTSLVSDSSLMIQEAGVYFVTVTDTNSCTQKSALTTIKMTPLPKVQLGEGTQMLCAGEVKYFSLDSQFSYLWENNSTSPKRTISEDGLYSVKAFNECDTVNDEVVVNTWDIDYPNVITPNGDGKNEAFVVSGISFGTWSLVINNRYGKIVYQTEDYQNDYVPENLSDGIYYFILSQGDECTTFKGWIQVIR
jgi:gliding motility-associated-like protein